MIDGVKMTLGGIEYIVPPLNLKAIKVLAPQIAKMGEATSQVDIVPLVGQLVLAALQRNYPEMTEEQVDDFIDLSNSQDVMLAVLAQSGFKPAGEAAATTADPSIGTTSTAS